MLNLTKEEAECSAAWSESELLYEGGFPTSQPLFYTRRWAGLSFSVRINFPNKITAIWTAAAGHFLLSWRSDDPWSHLGETEANRRSSLNPVKVRRTLLVSMSLGYWIFCSDLLPLIHDRGGGTGKRTRRLPIQTRQDCWAGHTDIVCRTVASIQQMKFGDTEFCLVWNTSQHIVQPALWKRAWKAWPFVLLPWSFFSLPKGGTLLPCYSYHGHFLELNSS